MHTCVKSRDSAIWLLMLVSFSFFDLSAELKRTWSKDRNGRILIYRAEPSKLEALTGGILSVWGLPFILVGFRPEMSEMPTGLVIGGMFILCGGLCTGRGLYLLNEWYHDYDSLHKPLIIIDKYGISYEGKDKILWKKVYECRRVAHIVFTNNGTRYWHGLEITTDIEKLQIYENKIAITLPMLFKLIDEAYATYQESEKEKIAV